MYDFKFADIGEGIHEGKILEWHYKVGDQAEEGETLVVIETDKVNAEIPLPVSGKIVKLGPDVGEIVTVGQTLAVIDDGGEAGESEDVADQEQKTETASEGDEGGVVGKIEVSDEVISSQSEASSESSSSERVLATPVARKLASDLGVDIAKVKGSGEHGRVLKTDIENHKSTDSTSVGSVVNIELPTLKTENNDKRIQLSTLRKSIVKAMTVSKQVIPHTTLMDELDISQLVSFRQSYKQTAQEQGIKLTYMAFIIKALTKTIRQFPVFNSQFDQENQEIILKGNINVGIAVDTPDGLIVPNIKNADQLSIYGLAKEVDRLATLAKERKVQLQDLQKGTISITNFGAFDAINGTPVIKHPEVAILGVGKISKKPIVKNNEIVIADILPLSLTFDHRIIDGADGGRFMIQFKKYLADPMLLLMS